MGHPNPIWCPLRDQDMRRDTKGHTERRANKQEAATNHVQTKKRGLRGNQPCQYFDLELPASRTRSK